MLQKWGKENRFAGSKDRRAIRDFVYDGLRIKRSALSRIKAPHSGRNWALGVLMEANEDLEKYFNDEAYGSPRLTPTEKLAIKEATKCNKPPDVEFNLPAFLWPIWKADLERRLFLLLSVYVKGSSISPSEYRKNYSRKSQQILCEEGIHTDKHPSVITALKVTNGQNKIKGAALPIEMV